MGHEKFNPVDGVALVVAHAKDATAHQDAPALIAAHTEDPDAHQDAPALIAAHAEDPDAHHVEIHGANKHTNITRELFLPAVGYTEGEVGPSNNYTIYLFVDGIAKEGFFTFKVPDDFISFNSVKLVWTTGAASGNMYWYLKANWGKSGESETAHTESPGAGATITEGSHIINVQEPANPLSLADLEKGDYVGISVMRYGENVNDTLDNMVGILGILFTYEAEQ